MTIFPQEINWEEATARFSAHNPKSLSKALYVIRASYALHEMPLYIALKDYLPNLKNLRERESVKRRRELIVHCYEKAREQKTLLC